MKTAGEPQQVKSRKRVTDHGEVFTSEREVKAMLDLVFDQTERVESTFLEPACGSGNFLVEILRRKLNILQNKYAKSRTEYDVNLIKAVCSIYGVELLPDNAEECRERLITEIQNSYRFDSDEILHQLIKSVKYILHKNIICGDALNYTTTNGEPIIFAEWKFINDTEVKQRCFDYQVVLDKGKQISLFGDDGKMAHIPKHGLEFPPTHYLKLGEDDAE